MSPLTILAALIGLVVGGAICFPAGFYYRKNVSEKEISSAEEEGKRIINEAIKSAETKKKEALLALKKKLTGRLQSVLGLGVDVKLVEPRSIERSVGKAKRVIDNRKL